MYGLFPVRVAAGEHSTEILMQLTFARMHGDLVLAASGETWCILSYSGSDMQDKEGNLLYAFALTREFENAPHGIISTIALIALFLWTTENRLACALLICMYHRLQLYVSVIGCYVLLYMWLHSTPRSVEPV